MFKIVEKLIDINNKEHNKMKNIKLITWVTAGRYISSINKRARKKLEN